MALKWRRYAIIDGLEEWLWDETGLVTLRVTRKGREYVGQVYTAADEDFSCWDSAPYRTLAEAKTATIEAGKAILQETFTALEG